MIAYRYKHLGVWRDVSRDELARMVVAPSGGSSRPDQVIAQMGGVVPSEDGEEVLSYLPLTHPAEQALVVRGGNVVHFGDGRQPLLADLREVQPTTFFAEPGFWEALHHETERRLAGATRLKRFAYGRRLFVRRALRRQLGLARVRNALTDGAVAPETRSWWSSIGIDLREAVEP